MNDDNDDHNVDDDDDDDDDDDEALPGLVPCHPSEFKTSRVSVYKCLSLIVGFAITVAIWPKETVSSRFHFTCCRYFLGHVASWNLPWQGLYVASFVWTPTENEWNA